MNADNIVVAMIALWGGELVERIRLQKGAYLLHRCGANLGLPFVYYDYGPYSFGLAAGCADTIEDGRIEIERRPGRHGIRYTIFRTSEEANGIGALSRREALGFVKKMKPCTDLALELAATIAFLRDEAGYGEKAVAETQLRKPHKATDERMGRARSLLCDLGLARREPEARSH